MTEENNSLVLNEELEDFFLLLLATYPYNLRIDKEKVDIGEDEEKALNVLEDAGLLADFYIFEKKINSSLLKNVTSNVTFFERLLWIMPTVQKADSVFDKLLEEDYKNEDFKKNVQNYAAASKKLFTTVIPLLTELKMDFKAKTFEKLFMQIVALRKKIKILKPLISPSLQKYFLEVVKRKNLPFFKHKLKKNVKIDEKYFSRKRLHYLAEVKLSPDALNVLKTLNTVGILEREELTAAKSEIESSIENFLSKIDFKEIKSLTDLQNFLKTVKKKAKNEIFIFDKKGKEIFIEEFSKRLKREIDENIKI